MIPVRSDLAQLGGYHSPQVDVPIRLNVNESPLPPPDAWRDEYVTALARLDWHRYPDRGAVELREAIAARHGVDPAMVFAANGSNEVLQTILLTYAGPGRTVLTFEPTYQMHSQIARVVGARTETGRRREDFTIDPAEVRRAIEDASPSVTFITSPNNPTGLVEPPASITESLAHSDGLVVVDEAYAEFAPWTSLSLVDDTRPLVVTRTYSKTWGMAGLRLGYVIGPGELVRELDKVALPYHLDAAKQLAGRLALRFVDEMAERVAVIVAERDRISAEMAAMDLDVTPSSANFVLFRPRDIAGHDVWRSLLDHGILVRDCSSWPRLSGCLRVTVGTANENDAFLTALGRITQ